MFDVINFGKVIIMKRLVSVLLSVILVVGVLSVSASARGPEDILLSREVEVLENGDTITTEIYLNAVQPMSGTYGYKKSIYSTASGKDMWAVIVNGTFTYTYGVSSQATSAEAIVELYDNGCKFISKNAYTHSNAATATCSVQYGGAVSNASVTLYCDIYGKLS